MGTPPEHVKLRVVSDNMRLPNIQKPIPKGEYDGYIYWQDESRRHMSEVQIVLKDHEMLILLGDPNGIPSMHCDVLRYLHSGDIERVEWAHAIAKTLCRSTLSRTNTRRALAVSNLRYSTSIELEPYILICVYVGGTSE